MADTEHSSSDETSVDSRGTINSQFWSFSFTCTTSCLLILGCFCSEETSQESKLELSEDEETLVIRMFNLVGERWSLIAGRIPGRTAEEIEKYWNTRCSTSE
ncbi:hypothetical protein DKX38_005411 [Salix brachista]|uniref:Uncharacterized protein n=1 Tax=Salix brachista TaxID=2182728 RepID=A0A5N5MZM4_9ROSI|nr:hypothetical protein DKX38_005411 [Salix brachista]